MSAETKHISTRINRPMSEVYAYAANPANLPAWASGLGSSIEFVDGEWWSESPMGRVGVAFAPPNEFGVLDHDVTLPTGQTVRNPMRVLADGDVAEVVFTLRRQPAQSDDDFARDADTVAADLEALRRTLESG